MTSFKYQALKNNKTLISGEIEAVDLRDARTKIRELGFIPTQVYMEDAPPEDIQHTQNIDRNKKRITFLSLTQIISFITELETFLSSQISILEALHNIEVHTPDAKIKSLTADLQYAIRSGLTFSQAISSLYRDVFGSVFVALIKTGEEAGELDLTLQRMLTLLKKQDRLKGKVVNASIYPCILLVMMFGLLTLFSVFVFPAFASIMLENGTDFPPMMQALMGICSFTKNFWWLMLLGFGAFCGSITQFVKNITFKEKFDKFVMKIPVLSEFIEYVNLSNFMSVLHVSYEAGVPLLSGLELANKTIGNTTIKDKFKKSILFTKQGVTLTESFERTDALPPAILSMIAAGETSGTLGKMFHDAVQVIDKKVDMALDALARLFEPTVIVIMGGVVLFIAIAFMQAYVGTLGSLF